MTRLRMPRADTVTFAISFGFVLLVLFEVETGFGAVGQHRGAAPVIHVIRFLAALAIAAAALGYLRDEAWLDAINAMLWIGVVALLEFEVRWPVAAATHRAAFLAVASALYAALAAVVLTPAVSMLSLRAIGTPCKGPRVRPFALSASSACASFSAESPVTVMYALMRGLIFSMRAR